MAADLLLVLIPLLVLVDPPASMALFLGLTQGRDRAGRSRIAIKGVLFATIVLLVFAAGGKVLLEHLGVELYSLQVAGGVMLGVIGLRMLREGREIPRRELRQVPLPTGGEADLKAPEGDPSFVPLGLPMLAGPGAISLVIVQSTDFGIRIVAAAILIVMASALLTLMVAARLEKVLGDTGSRVLTRIMGILVVTFAAQYIFDGIDGWKAAG